MGTSEACAADPAGLATSCSSGAAWYAGGYNTSWDTTFGLGPGGWRILAFPNVPTDLLVTGDDLIEGWGNGAQRSRNEVQTDQLFGGPGSDIIYGNQPNPLLPAGVGLDVPSSSASEFTVDEMNRFFGNDGADFLFGSCDKPDMVNGGGGGSAGSLDTSHDFFDPFEYSIENGYDSCGSPNA